ncbi:MAG TPA: enolase C-terminal domain-like protein [Geminicoccaceae bacterium]|nr:enolase C-terminal domain-like protein [Geminicoccus sp.]HMU48759.1 enolase C-terminal domain-like protein [Geminicoccaceae bacterium]
MPVIRRIEIRTFAYTVEGLSIDYSMNAVYTPGAKLERKGFVVRITDSEGCVGEWVNVNYDAANVAQAQVLARMLIGRDADSREKMYDDCKRVQRKLWAFGYSDLDIALWDLAGKRYGVPISRLIGGFRERLPTYASTFHGDRNGGLSSKEAFADYAEYCYGLGFRAFKIHGWSDGNRREEAANVLHVASKVGDRMDLMLDPACELKSFGDALYVGRACDEANFFWYEDPYRDGGYSCHAHRKLRQLLKTPLLMGEHVRGLEAKADTIASEATDYVRANPTLDMGITGVMKIAHLAESFGLDCEMHGAGPAHRHCMSALRNTNFYELALCAPKIGNPKPPIYTCGYSDEPEDVGKDGCFEVPKGPGLGVSYDWDFIEKNELDAAVIG